MLGISLSSVRLLGTRLNNITALAFLRACTAIIGALSGLVFVCFLLSTFFYGLFASVIVVFFAWVVSAVAVAAITVSAATGACLVFVGFVFF